jgi:hypothetical protein
MYISKKTNTNKTKSINNNANRAQSVSSISNTSNGVFLDDECHDIDFELIKNNSNRNMSSTSSIELYKLKKLKIVFVNSTNRLNVLPTLENKMKILCK